MSGKLFLLCNNPSRSLPFRPSASYLYNPIKRYKQGEGESHDHVIEEKAPSLADEFRRVAEEKAKAKEEKGPSLSDEFKRVAEEKARAEEEAAEQGIPSQTADKAYDGTEEAVARDGDTGP